MQRLLEKLKKYLWLFVLFAMLAGGGMMAIYELVPLGLLLIFAGVAYFLVFYKEAE